MSRLDCYAMKDCLVKRMESYKNRETSTVILFLLNQKDGVYAFNLNNNNNNSNSNRPLPLEMSLCDSDLDGFSLHKLKLIISGCSGRGYLFGASWSNACLNYLYCFPYPFDGLAALLYFEPFNLSLFYSIVTTHKPIVKQQIKSQTDYCALPLPLDYNNWSSTLIIFTEDQYEITAYAFDFEHCVVYYLVSYERSGLLLRKMGYTVADFKLFFVGDIDHEDDGSYDSFSLETYDILNRRWITDDFPVLNAPKHSPFMFFLDGRLYVLTSSWGPHPPSFYSEDLPERTEFEMLDLNNLSQGWVFLPAPSFVDLWVDIFACDNAHIIDYSKKMLYVRMVKSADHSQVPLYGYSLHDNTWHEHGGRCSSAGRPGNLLKSLWSNNCVIVENYLYRFEMFCFDDDIREAFLIIGDLDRENNIEWVKCDNGRYFFDPPVDGVWVVDISSIVAPRVLRTVRYNGNLVYLGKRNSGLRFLLVISYNCESCSGATHPWTCMFDLRRSSTSLNQATAVSENSTESFIFTAVGENSTESFIFDNICCQYQHKYMVPARFSCHKLCNEM